MIDTNGPEWDVPRHILSWAENSQPHYRELYKIGTPGNFIYSSGRFHAAANLVARVVRDMLKGRDLGHTGYDEGDMALAVRLFLDWRAEA